MVKNPPANAGDTSLIPGSGISPRVGNGKPLSVFLPGKFYGQRSLVGYSPWGSKELGMTERLTLTHCTSWFLHQGDAGFLT